MRAAAPKRYDMTFVVHHLPDRLTQPFFDDAVRKAKSGQEVLWVCFEEKKLEYRDRFVKAGCNTNLVDLGVEVGAPDPTI